MSAVKSALHYTECGATIQHRKLAVVRGAVGWKPLHPLWESGQL